MSEVHLVIARPDHVPLVAARMREADRAEVRASGGYGPEEALRTSLEQSEFARTVFVGKEAMAMFGIVMVGEWAVPWLLTTDVVCRYPLTFWNASKVIFRELRDAYPAMVQFIDARHVSALSWARRLGFTVREPEPFGIEGRAFCPITIGSR